MHASHLFKPRDCNHASAKTVRNFVKLIISEQGRNTPITFR